MNFVVASFRNPVHFGFFRAHKSVFFPISVKTDEEKA